MEEEQEIKCEVLPGDTQSYDLSFKVIVIGDSGVGKSCLTLKAIKNQFEEYYTATVGFEFFTFNVQANQDKIKLQIWDTCGQEIYRSLISSFYKNSSLAMMVYSIDNHESFEHLKFWLNEVKIQSTPDIKLFLIGNKSDLEEKRQVSLEEAHAYVKDNNIDYFIEASAKTGFNAKNVFIEAAKTLYKNHMNYVRISNLRPQDIPIGNDERIPKPNTKLGEEIIDKDSNKKKGCC